MEAAQARSEGEALRARLESAIADVRSREQEFVRRTASVRGPVFVLGYRAASLDGRWG